MIRVYKENSYMGKKLIDMGSNWCGNTLNQIYDNWSQAKENAFNWCYEKYLNTPDHSSWGICSYNTFGFTVSWCGLYEGQEALFVETRDNSYVVLFDEN